MVNNHGDCKSYEDQFSLLVEGLVYPPERTTYPKWGPILQVVFHNPADMEPLRVEPQVFFGGCPKTDPHKILGRLQGGPQPVTHGVLGLL